MSHTISTPSLLNRAYMRVVDPFVNGKRQYQLLSRLKTLQRFERLSLDEQQARQFQAVAKLVRHAYDSTPFYRQRFDQAGIGPSDIRSLDDLKKIPILTRDDIRKNLDGLWSRRYSRESLQEAATGGTTDTPVPLLRSHECLAQRFAVQLHLDTWAQLWPGDRIFRLWGAQQDFNPNPSWRWRIYDRHVLRNVWAPTSLLNPEVLESYRNLLNEFRPKIIYAYPTPLGLFCEYLLDCGRPYHRPVSAVCTAEPLQDHQRIVIEKALGCRVFEHYGTRDFGMVGAECEAHEGMHLHSAAVYAEFVPLEGGEADGMCEILVTDLTNDGMPMIRYRINDCAIPSPSLCSCGRGFPLVKKIVGRTVDNFVLADGSVVPGVALTNRVIQLCPGLKKTQVIQNTVTDFHVRYVAGPGFSSSDLEMLRSKLRVFFTESVNWTFEEVSEIARERSGKTRFCISHVNASTARGSKTEPLGAAK